MEKRKTERRGRTRIPFTTPGELGMPDNTTYAVVTRDISLSGIRLDNATVDDKHLSENCKIKLEIPLEGVAVSLALQCQIVREEESGIGLKFFGVKGREQALFEKYLLSESPDPKRLLAELGKIAGKQAGTINLRHLTEELSLFIVEAVNDIFIAFLDLKITPGPAVMQMDHEDYQPPDAAVTGLVNFNGDVHGGVHLSAPLHVALRMASSFAGEPFEQMNAETCDAIGELTNMDAGGVQTRLAGDSGNIELTPPTVIHGSTFTVQYNRDFSSVKQYFRIDAGPFFLECFFA